MSFSSDLIRALLCVPRNPVDEVREAEFKQIARRRKEACLGTPTEEEIGKSLVGLALSGGGIRSASFTLGLVQALVKYGVIRHVDYLATVSGGSYVGARLASEVQALPADT